jgi:DMSO/TMAO reductase YedYZ heme-binding membrane subunit
MYLVPALETIGVDGAKQQLGIQLGLTATYFVFTLCGSYLVDKVTRRFLIFSGLISFILVQTAATITSWQYDTKGTKGAAYLTLL